MLEQTLGHITHADNLARLVPPDVIDPVFVPIHFDPGPRHWPIWSNWTVRAGTRARLGLIHLRRTGVHPDAMFIHTQVPAVLLRYEMHRTPTVISLDATPVQYDALGEHYKHSAGPRSIEALKSKLYQRCFHGAAHLITWSEWAKDSLIQDYNVAPECIDVVAPGVDLETWGAPDRRPVGSGGDEPVRILFVGGDLDRKGGDTLIEAVRRLRALEDTIAVEVDLVTGSFVSTEPGVRVHTGLTPNSPELIALYHQADVFCLPTRGDCLPMVLAEAAAAGLPLVSTNVGAIKEIVQPGISGRLVEPGDPVGLAHALRAIASDPDERRRLGDGAFALASRSHDASRNARRLAALLCDIALRHR